MNILRIIVCVSAILASTPLAHARAPGDDRPGAGVAVKANEGNGPERVGPRQRAVPATPYLQSTNRWSEMMLKDDAVYLQMTDYGLKQIGEPQESRERQENRKSDDSMLGNLFKAMALSGVKQFLDHSLALSLTNMRAALVRDGAVVLVTCQGKEIFNNVKINDQVQKFPQDQAEDFVKHVNRVRRSLPACRA